ncbi:MAG: hypothetical protein R3F35_00535 [Myxococcota bacterium]
MWQRVAGGGREEAVRASGAETGVAFSRRAYYRVSARVPIRVRRLEPAAVEAAVYDLSLPDPVPPLITGPADEKSALFAQLRRIEEKLDLLLGAASIEAPRPLSGRDRRPIVFSGAGLALEVGFDVRRGEAYRVELLLPDPHARAVRAIGEAVEDSIASAGTETRRRLALVFRHIQPADRDALVAYSYDVQRLELRAKTREAGARA